MHERFYLNACVKLKPVADKCFNICEVGLEVKADFISDLNLNQLYSEIMIRCVKELKTSRLNIVSTKLMPAEDKIKITANVLLAADEAKIFAREEDRYKKVEFSEKFCEVNSKAIYRLIKYMELAAIKERSGEFESVVHVRVIPCDKDDLTSSKF